MSNAFCLLTALPPTKGHRALIEFAVSLADRVNVIVCTQPGEPFAQERNWAVSQMCGDIDPARTQVHLIHKSLPQEPEGNEGFWDMWTEFLTMFGFQPGDTIVASERYGKPLADHAGGKFMPFDIDRAMSPYKATNVRNDPWANFAWIDHTFQPYLRKTVTIFGAESTGKSTLTNELHYVAPGHAVFEYARPLLENTSTDLSDEVMTDIWHGQKALQDYAQNYLLDKPFIIQDTDLYSTIGYWQMSEWAKHGVTPGAPIPLWEDAQRRKSDLYVITRSNIEFEPDPLRYGGDHREISDEDWITFAHVANLPYVVLESSGLNDRTEEALEHLDKLFVVGSNDLHTYKREGSEYV